MGRGIFTCALLWWLPHARPVAGCGGFRSSHAVGNPAPARGIRGIRGDWWLPYHAVNGLRMIATFYRLPIITQEAHKALRIRSRIPDGLELHSFTGYGIRVISKPS